MPIGLTTGEPDRNNPFLPVVENPFTTGGAEESDFFARVKYGKAGELDMLGRDKLLLNGGYQLSTGDGAGQAYLALGNNGKLEQTTATLGGRYKVTGLEDDGHPLVEGFAELQAEAGLFQKSTQTTPFPTSIHEATPVNLKQSLGLVGYPTEKLALTAAVELNQSNFALPGVMTSKTSYELSTPFYHTENLAFGAHVKIVDGEGAVGVTYRIDLNKYSATTPVLNQDLTGHPSVLSLNGSYKLGPGTANIEVNLHNRPGNTEDFNGFTLGYTHNF